MISMLRACHQQSRTRSRSDSICPTETESKLWDKRVMLPVNRRNGWSGHLWQGRFFSSPLDDEYLWFCVRCVERNPVRAGMVESAEDYPWSSAAAHCGLRRDDLLSTAPVHLKGFAGIENWSAWLHEEDDATRLGILRRNSHKNLPCGSDDFVDGLERMAGRLLRFRPIGRPREV